MRRAVTGPEDEGESETARRTSYYYLGAQRVTMRQVVAVGGTVISDTVSYLYGDHLGSTSVTTDASGTETSRQAYYAFGSVRTSTGSVPTDFGFTGQGKDDSLDGLMHYGARYYAPRSDGSLAQTP